MVATADGAIYAMRKSLFKEMDPALINDFMHPILASLQDAQSVMSREAVCFEEFSAAGEFARQVRMVSQAALVYFRLLPELVAKRRWRSIIVLTSHKLLRWLTAPLLGIAVVATLALAESGRNLPGRARCGDMCSRSSRYWGWPRAAVDWKAN